VVVLVAVLVLVGLASFLYVAWRRNRLAPAFIAVIVVLAVFWVLAYAAISTDYRDADGFIDCWPSCSRYQGAVAAAIWYGPVMLVVLGAFAGVLATIKARRDRRRRALRRSG
jgi:hypothetical protein